MLTLRGDAHGKLHVCRQVEDYTLRGVEFETMGFLSFTVETYERRLGKQTKDVDDNGEDEMIHSRNPFARYLSNHPKVDTHYRTLRSENHNFLPNIVGSWFPRRDGEESASAYYYAAMLAVLKPWRDLRQLKSEDETWELAFTTYIQNASQREKDVVAGCQYYYETKSVVANREFDDERKDDGGGMDDDHMLDDDGLDDEPVKIPVRTFVWIVKH
jgi:hypothetical protein